MAVTWQVIRLIGQLDFFTRDRSLAFLPIKTYFPNENKAYRGIKNRFETSNRIYYTLEHWSQKKEELFPQSFFFQNSNEDESPQASMGLAI